MRNSTLTTEQQQAITDLLKDMVLPSGLGTAESACSIAAINLALTGKLTDTIPDCMSNVIGQWIIRIQDRMPNEIRNGVEWKQLLPLAAGTGRLLEHERLQIILDHMWTVSLPLVQSFADSKGFGVEWKAMCDSRTVGACQVARNADADADADADAAAYAAAAYAAYAAYAADAADAADADAAAAADAADAAVANAAYVATAAVANAANAANAATDEKNWKMIDPCALLKKLIET
jgi:hypothetical protein